MSELNGYQLYKLEELLDSDDDLSLSAYERNMYHITLSRARRNKSIDIEKYYRVIRKIELGADNYLNNQINKRKKIRNKASTFTSKKEVREKIFNEYGKECLNCGSTKKIQLDHIKPICRGGKNDIDNLQPLCKHCNTSKGPKIIDYR